MNKLTLKRDPNVKAKDWIRQRAYLEHGPLIVHSDVQAFDEDTGEHLFTFVRVPESIPLGPLLAAVRTIPYERAYRTSGLLSHSKTFGYQPRIPIRRDFCAVAGLAYTHPKEHAVLMEYGLHASDLYNRDLPMQHDGQIRELAAQVKPMWRHGHFTSGIVNDKNVLTYHKDQGNFPDMLSTMFSIARDMHGTNGRLVLPEYGVSLEFDGFEMLTFSGANVIHGVTPISVKSQGAERYTIVYYPLKGVAACGTPDEELERIKRVKTGREQKRHSAHKAELTDQIAGAKGMSAEELHAAGERKRALFERKKRT